MSHVNSKSVETAASHSRAPTVAPAPAEISGLALARIEQAMRQWRTQIHENGSGADFFRYETFARRLVAAEYGRPDAVEWAWQWYLSLLDQDAQEVKLLLEIHEENENRHQFIRREIAQGRSSNPRFQAFLDTLEYPEAELYHEDGSFQGWKYLVWIVPLVNSIESECRNKLPPEQRDQAVTQAVIAASRKQLAPRLDVAGVEDGASLGSRGLPTQ